MTVMHSPISSPVAEATTDNEQSLLRLLQRMREGDREAAATFITRYEARIRRRIRGKLHQSMRRIFDSEEIFSSIRRRLDDYVHQGRLEAVKEAQLWSLIHRMADNTLVDKQRVFRRLENAEGADSVFAREVLARLRDVDRQSGRGVELEIDRALRSLPDPVDRKITLFWLEGMTSRAIADELNLEPSNVRKRWERIRNALRKSLSSGTSAA